MNRRSLLLIVSLVVVLALPAFAGAQKESARVSLRFFTGKTETVQWMNELISGFQTAYPNIEVQQEFQKDAFSVIKVKLASGDYPDITTVYTPEYAQQGLYLDLSAETAWWSRVLPSIKDKCTDVKTGKQFRIATNMTMAGLYSNKKIFSDLGIEEASTWADFKSDLIAVRDKLPGTSPMFVGGKDSWMLGHLIEFMAHGVIKQQMGDLESRRAFLENRDAQLRFGAADGPMAMFAKRFLELRDENLFNRDLLTATYDNQLDAFAKGQAASISQGMWALAGILQRNPGMKDGIGFGPYPPIVDGTKPTILSAEDSAYLIMAASKNQKEAKVFLSYLFKPENLKSYSEFLKSPSSFTDVDADWGPLKDEVRKALGKGVNIGFTTEAPAGFSGDDAGRMVQELYMGKYGTPLDFAKAYKSSWDTAWAAGAKK